MKKSRGQKYKRGSLVYYWPYTLHPDADRDTATFRDGLKPGEVGTVLYYGDEQGDGLVWVYLQGGGVGYKEEVLFPATSLMRALYRRRGKL